MRILYQLALTLAVTLLLAHHCQSATIRDSSGRQINFPDSETVPEADGGQPQPRGFLQRIFDMIKNLLGMDTRTTIVRNDGTIEEVEVPNGGGFLSRIGKRILGFINSVLGVLTGDNGAPRQDYANIPSRSSNEIERELLKMANGQRS